MHARQPKKVSPRVISNIRTKEMPVTYVLHELYTLYVTSFMRRTSFVQELAFGNKVKMEMVASLGIKELPIHNDSEIFIPGIRFESGVVFYSRYICLEAPNDRAKYIQDCEVKRTPFYHTQLTFPFIAALEIKKFILEHELPGQKTMYVAGQIGDYIRPLSDEEEHALVVRYGGSELTSQQEHCINFVVWHDRDSGMYHLYFMDTTMVNSDLRRFQLFPYWMARSFGEDTVLYNCKPIANEIPSNSEVDCVWLAYAQLANLMDLGFDEASIAERIIPRDEWKAPSVNEEHWNLILATPNSIGQLTKNRFPNLNRIMLTNANYVHQILEYHIPRIDGVYPVFGRLVVVSRDGTRPLMPTARWMEHKNMTE